MREQRPIFTQLRRLTSTAASNSFLDEASLVAGRGSKHLVCVFLKISNAPFSYFDSDATESFIIFRVVLAARS